MLLLLGGNRRGRWTYPNGDTRVQQEVDSAGLLGVLLRLGGNHDLQAGILGLVRNLRGRRIGGGARGFLVGHGAKRAVGRARGGSGSTRRYWIGSLRRISAPR